MYRAPKGYLRRCWGISASGLRKIEKIINGTWPPRSRCSRGITVQRKGCGK
jgi:hypothetical protein